MGMNEIMMQKLGKVRTIKLKDPENNLVNANTNNEINKRSIKRRKNIGFEDEFVRFTTYLTNSNYELLNRLRDENAVGNVTLFINSAVSDYISQHY